MGNRVGEEPVNAQEQAKEQQRQAGPLIQPTESPAHDRARQTFVQVAGPLAKELREAGAGLVAVRLQQVSKYLLKQPELRATDVENLGKVLAALDKLPALKNRADVQKLRQAVQVLDKPVQVLDKPVQGYGQQQSSVQQKPKPPAQEVRKRGP